MNQDINRKDEHLNLALEFQDLERKSDFDNLEFVHNVFPEVNYDDVDISTKICGYDLSHPFHMNGMTGGSELTKKYNEKFAILARETNTFMSVGSLSVALKNKGVEDTFNIVRKRNPNGIIFANLGADKTLEDAKKACQIIDADGIQIHVNAAQEIIMPEGERFFEGWLNNISNIIDNLGLPVIIKEVGFGMSRKAIKNLKDIGAKTIDISGKGGTSFAIIENSRREEKEKLDFLNDYGNSTVVSLLEAKDYIDDLEIISSSGIRNSMDIVKSLALGAKSTAMAGRFLKLINEYEIEDAIDEVNKWKLELKSLFTLLGAKNIEDLKKTDLIIKNDVKNWCDVRNIDYRYYANRSDR